VSLTTPMRHVAVVAGSDCVTILAPFFLGPSALFSFDRERSAESRATSLGILSSSDSE
jgi:hypothetical protein